MRLSDFDCVIWNKEEEEYEHPSQVLRILECKSSGKDISEYEIELFTGICDKKNKKIYENDILKVSNGVLEYLAKVVMNEDRSYSLYDKNSMYSGQLLSLVKQGYTFEIVGNMKQNEYLMTGKRRAVIDKRRKLHDRDAVQ